jgi:chromosome segregation ATPase
MLIPDYRRNPTLPLLAAVVAFGLPAGLARAQEGIKQTEAVVKKGEDTIKSITEARAQLEKTLTTYNSIIDGKAPDSKAAYKDLQKAVKDCEAKSADVKQKKEQMDAEADKLYTSWSSSLTSIGSSELRQKSEARLNQTKDRMGKIAAAGMDARATYDSFLGNLKDQVTFLGNDLTPGGVTALKSDAAKLNDRAKEMFGKIDGTLATANSSLNALRQP